MPQRPGGFSQTCLVLESVFQCFFVLSNIRPGMKSLSNMFRDWSYIILQVQIHIRSGAPIFMGKCSIKMMLKVNWSLGSVHLIFHFLLAMCKRCRDHLQILTANASPVSQGNPTLMDISASETLAGDTLEEKSSESSEHKSTQVGSEKVHSFVSAF